MAGSVGIRSTLVLAVLLALVGRAVAVYSICLMFSRSRWAVPLNEQLPLDLPQREEILIVAFAVVAFSVIVQGLAAPLALRWLELAPAKAAPVAALRSPSRDGRPCGRRRSRKNRRARE